MPAMDNLVMTSCSSSPASHQGSIQSLPLELIREIFLFSTALKLVRLVDEFPIPPRFSTTALALSHVCAHWRFIALSFPELWASIAVCCPTDHIVRLTKLYLERSGETTLLDLSLIDVLNNAGPCDEWHATSAQWERCALDIMSLWIPRAHRWVGVNLTLRMWGPIPELLHIPPQHLSKLEKASLDFSSWEPCHIQRMWDIVHTSKALTAVHWHSNLVNYPSLTTFQHITDLYVRTISLEELASLPSLKHLVKFAVIGFKESPDVGVVHLPALESLSIESLQYDSSWLFDQIATPSLCDLHLEQRARMIDVSALHRFLSRTSCPLQRLYIHASRSSEADLLQYMQLAAPSLIHLRELALGVDWITELTVNTFTPNDREEIFLPFIKELFLFDCQLEDGLIAKMVLARASVGKPLA
ncbi:hypothetical protein BDN72DRAFT_966102, partial [Pluteus cervinus]